MGINKARRKHAATRLQHASAGYGGPLISAVCVAATARKFGKQTDSSAGFRPGADFYFMPTSTNRTDIQTPPFFFICIQNITSAAALSSPFRYTVAGAVCRTHADLQAASCFFHDAAYVVMISFRHALRHTRQRLCSPTIFHAPDADSFLLVVLRSWCPSSSTSVPESLAILESSRRNAGGCSTI